MDTKKSTFVFALLVFAGVFLRLTFRDVPNFAPVAALALFAGFYFQATWMAALVPVTVLSITNIELGGYQSWAVMFAVYACLILPVFFGRVFLKSNKPGEVRFGSTLACSLGGSLLFFFVTNYVSWYFWYPQNVEGFVSCYWAAVPFFRYTLAGDLFFTCAFFGGYALLYRFRFSESTQLRPIAL